MAEVAQTIRTHQLGNGLVLVLQPMEAVQSVAFSLLVPAGSGHDDEGRNGTAAVLCDLVTRGAGERDSRELSSALDDLGVQRHEGVTSHHLSFSAATISHQLESTLRIYADIVRHPRLPADQFEPARLGVAQALRAIEDEPRQKVMIELRRRCYGSPWGRPADGRLDELESVTMAGTREHFRDNFRPNDAILGVAGRFDADVVVDLAEELFGDWDRGPVPVVETTDVGPPIDHVEHESTQTQLGIAFPAIPYRDPDYYAAWAAVSILSGGSSSRLWNEVREKRGLCYSVYATLSSLRDRGYVLCYAGTTTERAQETMDVILEELARLGEGIDDDELLRCKARAKTALVMQQESSMSRAGSIARDWFHLGRVKTLREIQDRVDALTIEDVLGYVHRRPPGDYTIVTIGPEPLDAGPPLS